MVKEYETQQTISKYDVSEQIDCLDERGQWLNAEIIEINSNKLKVHYCGFSKNFDEWINEDSNRIQKQWRHGQEFRLNNRIDVIDTYNYWKEARIIDLNDTQIKIHYKGYSERYDEWIHKNSERIKEIGSKSTAFGIGRTDPSNSSRYSKKEIQPDIKTIELSTNRENRFKQLLSEKDWIIVSVEGDGNCLFRAVSHQLYGMTSFHDIIRASAMKYISLQRDYFSQFIVGGIEKVDEYLSHQSRSGAWGDDIEIQALSEIYNKPFEIYAYSNIPMRTFHEHFGIGSPLRLSYHGQSHYNSIANKDKHLPLLNLTPGEYENNVLESISRGELNEQVERSRQEFEASIQIDLEQALLNRFDENESEDLLVRHAIEESNNTDYLNAVAMSITNESEEEMIRQAIEISKQEALPPAINDVINSGFTIEQALEAWHAVGDNPNQMIEYIFNNLL